MRRAAVVAAAVGTVSLLVGGALAWHLGAGAALGEFLAPIPKVARRPVEEAGAPPATRPPLGTETKTLADVAAEEKVSPAPAAEPVPTLLATPVRLEGAEPELGVRVPPFVTTQAPPLDALLRLFREQGPAHEALVDAHRKCLSHKTELVAGFGEHDVPPELAAVAYVESRCVATAVGPRRAGLFGLTGPEAKAFDVVVLSTYDERRNVRRATDGLAHFLADARERLGGWEAAVLAHRVGYATAVAALTDGPLEIASLATDARIGEKAVAYVAEVLAVAVALANPRVYGLPDTGDDDAITQELEVHAGAPLATIAQAARMPLAELRALNPEYLGDTVPATGFQMFMRFPGDHVAHVNEALLQLLYSNRRRAPEPLPTEAKRATAAPSAAAASDGVAGTTGDGLYYRPRQGDSLESLARRFGTAADVIASDNGLRLDDALKPGVLVFVRAKAPAAAPPASAPVPSSAPAPTPKRSAVVKKSR